MTDPLKNFQAGLRCHDVHAGLRNVDPNSPTATPLADTRIIGMAASLASLVRGQDVVPDAESLKTIVADQLDISPYAFGQVINTLEGAGMISDVQRRGSKIISFTESVPFYENLYDRLGHTWRDGDPSQIEQEVVAVVDRLARGPVPAEELEGVLGLDGSDVPRIIELGKASELVQGVELIDGEVLYSPFFGFENPTMLAQLLTDHGSGQFGDELAAVRAHQGLPLDAAQYPALADAVARGFITAPTVLIPDGTAKPFAAVPYVPDTALLTARKTVLEKALAVLACVRCGQYFGGATATRSPVRVLNALLDAGRNHTLTAHSSHKRQYQLLYRMQVVDFIPSGNWVRPKLIVTEDNLEAVRIARDLLTYGEPIQDRISDDGARALLSLNARYEAPLQTVRRTRQLKTLSERAYRAVLDRAMGRAAL